MISDKVQLHISQKDIDYSAIKNIDKNIELYYKPQENHRNISSLEPEVLIAIISAGSLLLSSLIKNIFLLLRDKNNKIIEFHLEVDGKIISTKNIEINDLDCLVEKVNHAKEKIVIKQKS